MPYFSFICVFILFSCTHSDQQHREKSDGIPFDIEFGMSHEEVRSRYADCEFTPMEPGKYGLCGGGTGFDVSRNDTLLFYFWEDWKSLNVGGIVILSPNYLLDDSIRVGMKLDVLLKKYPASESFINLESDRESIFIAEKNYWINFDTNESNQIAEYTFDQGESEFVKYINTDVQISSIMLKPKD